MNCTGISFRLMLQTKGTLRSSFFIKAAVQNRDRVAADITSLQYSNKHERSNQYELNLAA
jgi:hypothetical protein